MDLPDWVEELWGELRFKEMVERETGEGYQRLFQQVMRAVLKDDFLEVRSAGRYGDLKCDGWEMQSSTCYAVYGPFTRKSPSEVRGKLLTDLRGAIKAWPEMCRWRPVHNDLAGLSAPVAKAMVSLREEASTSAPDLQILPPWGPLDLWWLLRQAPAETRTSVLGTHGWQLRQDRLLEFVGILDDPVSISAGRSVVQLLDGFASQGIVDPLAAHSFASTLASFLLSDESGFEQRSILLERCCRDNPFETMLTSVVFCVMAVKLWEEATRETASSWAEMMAATEITIPYIIHIVISARSGIDLASPLPGRPEDQQKVTMNLGEVTAMTIELVAKCRPEPIIVVLQDLFINVQRERPSSPLAADPADGSI
jgi:hypothetical protein